MSFIRPSCPLLTNRGNQSTWICGAASKRIVPFAGANRISQTGIRLPPVDFPYLCARGQMRRSIPANKKLRGGERRLVNLGSPEARAIAARDAFSILAELVHHTLLLGDMLGYSLDRFYNFCAR